MTTETKQQTEQEIKDTWLQLWRFAQREISWANGTIDFDSFFEEGCKIFEVKIHSNKEC